MIDTVYLKATQLDLIRQMDEAKGQVSALSGALQIVDAMITKLDEEAKLPEEVPGQHSST